MPRLPSNQSPVVFDADGESGGPYVLYWTQAVFGSLNKPVFFHPELNFSGVDKRLCDDGVYNLELNVPNTIDLCDMENPESGTPLHPVTFTPIEYPGNDPIQIIVAADSLKVEFDFEYNPDIPLEHQPRIYLVAKNKDRCKALPNFDPVKYKEFLDLNPPRR